MNQETIRVLLVDDDEDDYVITRDLLAEVREVHYEMEWVSTCQSALDFIVQKKYDVCLFDYCLGEGNGLWLLREVIGRGYRVPVIMLTGQGDHGIDLEALKAGAADYLVKGDLQSSLLEHAIRYALERKRMDDELFQEKERAIVTLESIGDSVITTDLHGMITQLNPVAEKITGWSNAEAEGLPFHDIITLISEVTRKPIDNPVVQVLSQNMIINFSNQTVFINRNEQEYAVEGTASPIRNRENQIIGIVIVMHDVTGTRELSRKIAYQASHDPLTDLYNRAIFEEYLRQLLDDAKDQNHEHVLFYLDLDRFKIVNDTCGHFAGDQLLRQVSSTMKQKIRKMDIIARLGGDEFGIILTNYPFSQAYEIGEKIRQAVSDIHFLWDEKLFSIEVSIGAVAINSECKSVEYLLGIADQSCYMAKEKGGNQIHFFLDDDCEFSDRWGETQWISVLNQAFVENSFCLYFQPIIAIADGNPKEHIELLLRLRDKKKRIILPSLFLPAAQRYNMMTAIDRWVIDFYLRFYEKNYQGIPVDKIPVFTMNLSGSSLNDDHFLRFLKEQLLNYRIPPNIICFEITETIAINNYNKAIQFINELKSMGCLFALDDFGVGLSSFNYLKKLPIDYIKIGGAFIQNLMDSPLDYTIVESINQIGHILGIRTIAEVVENETVFEVIRKIGIDYGQGFWFGKPQPIECLAVPSKEHPTQSPKYLTQPEEHQIQSEDQC
jgi:diguanylate cyclase (GGDEF)-like protein/PAS domain S-box-containing protein